MKYVAKSKDTIRLVSLLFSFFIISALSAQNALPKDWHKLHELNIQGANTKAAISFLKNSNLSPTRPVIVGIIDSGVDSNLVDLRHVFWINSKEVKDGQDNDNNGFVDDVHGWNFLGTKDKSFNMISAGTQEFREFKRLYPKYKELDKSSLTDTLEYAYYEQMMKKAGIKSYIKFFQFAKAKDKAYEYIDSILKKNSTIKKDTLTLQGLVSLNNSNPEWETACQTISVDMYKAGGDELWNKFFRTHKDNLGLMEKRLWGIENEKDKRLLMGDDLKDFQDRFYGNPVLQVEGYEHGTFVASVIAGKGNVDPEVTGVFPEAKLMIVRAIPEGDEYDKDIASSIYYAVDNGAKVINMSFGKYLSPDSKKVNEAIKYAEDKDVLLVQAAGNDGLNIDSITYYPTAVNQENNTFSNFLRVGASDPLGKRCSFSNYGKDKVDLFAPGIDILGVMPDNKFERSQGSSISAPIVSAIAAMIRTYFPCLKANEVKDILIKTVHPMQEKGLSRSNGYIDALAAVKLALQATGKIEKESVNWSGVEKFDSGALNTYIKDQLIFPNWIKDSHLFYYNIKQNNEVIYYLFDAKTGKKRKMIKDNDAFVKQYTEITGDSLDAKDIQLYGFKFKDNDFRRFYLTRKGKAMQYDMATGILAEVKETEEKQRNKKEELDSYHSRDSLYTMLGCGYDLYLRDNSNGKVTRITADGKEDASYTYHNSTDTVETNSKGFWQNQCYIHVMRDDSKVKEMGFVNALSEPRPTVKTFKMPMPGDKEIRQYRIFWYNAAKGEGKYLPIEKYPDQEIDLDYFRSDSVLFFTRKSRGADKIDLCRIRLNDGTIEEIISEETKPHINLSLHTYRILDKGKRFIWWSERTGKGNYYLYNHQGKLLNRITQGENLVAGQIVLLDSAKNELVFAGYGQEKQINPYYTLYYRVGLNGKNQVLLTPSNGNHELSFCDNKSYAIDTYSRMDLAPVVETFAINNPNKRFKVEAVNDDELRKSGWKAPVFLKVKAADKVTDLYGLMYLPTSLDSTKKYPIISNVYPGPQDDQIPHSFSLDDNGNQSLAELGFIVINVAPRGSSPLRGKDFYCYSYGNLRDYPLEDDKYVIEQLADKYKFIDLNKVGIYGHSGGAFQAATAILTYPSFYKVAVAASGNHDNNIYIRWWGETFHGLATEGTNEKYIPTNIELAGNLQGRLLLMTGDVDKNVPPASTLRLANALIKEGKRFDMFIFPGMDHGLAGDYYKNIIRYYFVENLLGISQQHINIITHK